MEDKKEKAAQVTVYIDPREITDLVIEEIQHRRKMLTGRGFAKKV